MSVDIPMTTYNAERYLRNQLLSLQQHSLMGSRRGIYDAKSDELDSFGY